MLSFPPARILLTLALALAAAVVCLALRTPLPWMIGPLVATALLSIAGAPTDSSRRLRNAGQWTLGAALGLYFTPQVTALVTGLWWAIALGVVWALFGGWLYRVHAPHLPDVPAPVLRATSYFSGAIGAASEMTLLAEREHARTDLVAASHSLRLVIVTVIIPFALQFSGLHGLDLLPPAVRAVDAQGLALFAALTGLGALAMDRLGRANPWFMGALLVSMGLAMAGITLSAVPQVLLNAAQLVIGVSLGVRFRPGFLHTAPRWLGSVAMGTLVLLAVCALFAVGLSRATGLHWVTMVLSSAPGGIAEMSITAKVLQLGVPVVTAFQVCRLIAVLLLVAPMYRWVYPRDASAG
ncbi:AbrB family transcriptional regulator [Acidovorax sp. SUPP3334]|uniref:AbrB family transcriptional regulator n=1 Tax=Acidovorax sp. SUPP3334 TaxID=2920881 RepID=UPI0023DE2B3B|nr:AbrB family transcriptional regulator [Acidovorax sp. SUPP3334]GKT24240.1 AbrB family transcriptional regulator [Acidovorax sp. SUPP3334]